MHITSLKNMEGESKIEMLLAALQSALKSEDSDNIKLLTLKPSLMYFAVDSEILKQMQTMLTAATNEAALLYFHTARTSDPLLAVSIMTVTDARVVTVCGTRAAHKLFTIIHDTSLDEDGFVPFLSCLSRLCPLLSSLDFTFHSSDDDALAKMKATFQGASALLDDVDTTCDEGIRREVAELMKCETTEQCGDRVRKMTAKWGGDPFGTVLMRKVKEVVAIREELEAYHYVGDLKSLVEKVREDRNQMMSDLGVLLQTGVNNERGWRLRTNHHWDMETGRALIRQSGIVTTPPPAMCTQDLSYLPSPDLFLLRGLAAGGDSLPVTVRMSDKSCSSNQCSLTRDTCSHIKRVESALALNQVSGVPDKYLNRFAKDEDEEDMIVVKKEPIEI